MPQELVQGSLEPALRLTLTDALTGDRLALSGASNVVLRGVQYDLEVFETVLAGPFTDDGVVERQWEPGDTDTPGRIWVIAGVEWGVGRWQWIEAADVVDVLPR